MQFPVSGNSGFAVPKASFSFLSPQANIKSPSAIQDNYGVNLSDLLGISNSNSALSEQYAQSARNWSQAMQEIVMEFNSEEAAKNRDWQEFMSNTAHQREVLDLLKAGLNPVLSAGGGNGASVGSGSTASVSVPGASQGSVDTQGSSAVVNLLTSLLMAQTNILNTATSANATMAAASKTAAASQYAADISRANAMTSASATRYAAGKSYEGSVYSSQLKGTPQAVIEWIGSLLGVDMKDTNLAHGGRY